MIAPPVLVFTLAASNNLISVIREPMTILDDVKERTLGGQRYKSLSEIQAGMEFYLTP